MSRFSVRCGDHADAGDPDEEWEVTGFSSAETAREYARRFIRAQVEDLRQDAATQDILRDMYFRWGEFALAEGLDTVAWVEFCLANPASKKSETDYAALESGGRT